MPPAAPSRKTDGFDMAKLQKSNRQRQQRGTGSQNTKPKVARLTPAEIRLLSQSAIATTEPPGVSSTVSAPRRRSSATPPITPDHDRNRPLPRSLTAPLPTPPRSPVKHGHRQSQTPHRDHRHGRSNRSSSTAKPVNPHVNASRHSSVSSYRSANSLQMYRGHEVTQTGNKVMLQRPKQEIVSNPLSMFSRPRQSQLQASTSPDKFKRDFLELDPYQAQAMLDNRPGPPSVSSRAPSPPRMTDSPVSADEAEDAKQVVTPFPTDLKAPTHDADATSSKRTEEGRSGSQETIKPPKAAAADIATQSAGVKAADAATDATKEASTSESNESTEAAAPTSASHESMQPSLGNGREMEHVSEPDTPRKDARKRFTFHHVFDKKEKDKQAHATKKDRRNTLTFTKSPQASPQPSQEPFTSSPTGLSANQKDAQQDLDSDIIPSHPAVRPPSIRSRASSIDSKQRPTGLPPLNTSGPMYGRCACCGKIKRPNGHGTELSPVMENENLRTNFSLEADRTSYEARRYTPIIPIEVPDKDDAGSIRTVQGTIEPWQPQSAATSIRNVRTNGDARHSNSSSLSVTTTQTTAPTSISDAESPPRASKRLTLSTLEEPRIVRFSSLHAPRGGNAVEEPVDSEEEIVQSVPFVLPNHRSLVPQLQPQQRVILPSQQKILQQPPPQQYRHSAMPAMSGAVQRTPHPLRQSSPRDQMVEGLVQQHAASSNASIVEAQKQEIKRVPKQDIITVIPLNKQSTSADSSPQAASPSNGLPAGNVTANASPPQAQQSSEPAPNKLKKNNPGSSPQGHKARRLSLPTAHRFRLSSAAKRAETVPLPYTSVQPGTPPETDPALRPPLPSQNHSARTSMSSAAEARDHRASMSTSRRASRSQERSNGVTDGDGAVHQIQGVATGTFTDGGGKQVRPSPSFARFVANLPATHANNVPEAKRFGWRRKGTDQQKPVGTITESERETMTPASSISSKTAKGGRSRATSVNGVSEAAAEALPTAGLEKGGLSRPLTLPQLQLGAGLGSSGTIHRLAHGESLSATEPKTSGFVGGVKLEQMLERQRSLAVEGRV